MSINRREFLGLSALSTGAISFSNSAIAAEYEYDLPKQIRDLKPLSEGPIPITVDERKQRIAKAQQLMEEQKIDGIFMEGNTSSFYFTGMKWGQSERTFGLVIPARGAVAYVCPKFEESRAKELINPAFGDEVRCWEEDESPYALIVKIINDRGASHKRIGIEERVRFFIADGIRKEAIGHQLLDATPITAGCRLHKSHAEIALMQHANDVTMEAYKSAFATVKEGMKDSELAANISAAHRKLGFGGSAMVLVGKYTAIPHGTTIPQTIREGDVILVDGGTSVEGYASDITEPSFTKPSQKMF
jgi:Xaa-Pro dipeptidase